MTDIQTHILKYLLVFMKLSVCSLDSVTQFVCVFNLVMLPILRLFNFSVQEAFHPKDIPMCFVSVLGLIDFLKSLAPKMVCPNAASPCIALITSYICSLICQMIHLKSAFTQQHHSLKLWTMILFYLQGLKQMNPNCVALKTDTVQYN